MHFSILDKEGIESNFNDQLNEGRIAHTEAFILNKIRILNEDNLSALLKR
jgi:hypothetical protein